MSYIQLPIYFLVAPILRGLYYALIYELRLKVYTLTVLRFSFKKVKGLSLPYATERLLYLNVGIRARLCLLGDLGLSKRTCRYYYFF